MMRSIIILAPVMMIGPLYVTNLGAKEIPSRPLGEKDKLIFSDDFERAELGPDMRSPRPSFVIRDGILVGRQEKPDHGGTLGTKMSLPDGNLILEVKIRFAGASSINFGCDDTAFSGTHAGHIAGVRLKPTFISLLDKKEGRMRNDIYALRKSDDREKVAQGNRMIVGREADVPYNFKPNQWYLLNLEIVGDEMRVSIDGRPVGYLKSPGLTHPIKRDLRLSAWGKDKSDEAHFDELRIWSVKQLAAK